MTDDQRELLQVLVDSHAADPGPIKRATLAATVGCHPVTVSNRMGNLRALGLAESTSGPRGGYEPTLMAYDALANRANGGSVDVSITRDGDPVDGLRVRGFTVVDAHDRRRCRGELSLDGPVAAFAVGDAIGVGPIPTSKFHVEGTVVENDPATDVIIIDIEALHAPATAPDTSTDPERETHTLSG